MASAFPRLRSRLPLDHDLQIVDRMLPARRNHLQVCARLFQAPRIGLVEHFAPELLMRHQPGTIKHLKVPHNGLSGYPCAVSEGRRSKRSAPKLG